MPLVTVLQPTIYLDNLNAPWSADRVVHDGVIAYPLPGEAALPFVAAADVAHAVERARIVGEVLGRPVGWDPRDVATWARGAAWPLRVAA